MASPTAFHHSGHVSSPSSPHNLLNESNNIARKRKRSSNDGDGRSPGHESASPHQHSRAASGEFGTRKRSNLSKRACNECRQQKLRCDVVVEPNYLACSRCRRLNLDCRIDANFRRVDKRNKHVEMENELQDLRRRLAEKDTQSSSRAAAHGSSYLTAGIHGSTVQKQSTPTLSELHQGAADSLLELRHSTAGPLDPGLSVDPTETMKLEKVILNADQIRDLFALYFGDYHPFLPILDPAKSPYYFYHCSELLFWSIVAVAARRYEDDTTLLTGIAKPLTSLIWTTVADVTQNYHVVKALCLMCTWPLPTKTSSKDPTFMYSGLMMQIALQTGLHRPSHVQEYSRVKLDLREEDIVDRLKTWAGCNIVSQAVSTGFGQPPRSQWDYTLTSPPSIQSLPQELQDRLQVERFCNKVSRLVYMNRSDPVGLARDEERPTLISILTEDYRDLEAQIANTPSPVARLHLQAVGLHLKLSAFFDPPDARTFKQDLHELYSATIIFLNTALGSPYLAHVGMYMVQMILAGGFTLLKLLNSFFKAHTDIDYARSLFNQTIQAIRKTSIYNNDLPARLAEVLAQLWRSYGAGMRETPTEADDSLQLRVRARLSASVVHDSVWRWREQNVFKTDPSAAASVLDGGGNVPSSVEPSGIAAEAITDSNNLTNIGAISAGPMLPVNHSALGDSVGDWNYEVFEPLMSMLDNGAEFPYGDPTIQPGMTIDSSNMFS